MTPHEMSVIARFTRQGGHIPWQSVAAILGRNPADLRRDYDSVSAVAITFDPANIGPIDSLPDLPEPDCYRSTRAKGPDLREVILAQLAKRPESVDVLSAVSQRSPESIRMRLSQMFADGLVEHDNRAGRAVGRTWSLSVFGREVYNRERQERAA